MDVSKSPLPNFRSKSFMERADDAAFWEAWVATVLCRSGLDVIHQSFKIGEEHYHPERTDLHVIKQNDRSVPVEVKSSRMHFTGPNDYPDNEVFACSESSYKRKGNNIPYTLYCDFLIVSKQTGNIVWIPRGTFLEFRKSFDSSRQETFTALYATRKSVCNLANFIEDLLDLWSERSDTRDPTGPFNGQS